MTQARATQGICLCLQYSNKVTKFSLKLAVYDVVAQLLVLSILQIFDVQIMYSSL